MRAFIQEYGRTILVAIIGSLSIGICYFYLTSHIFRIHEDTAEQTTVSASGEPIIVAPDVIKIAVGDKLYDALGHSSERNSKAYQEIYERYLDFVVAYESSTEEISCLRLTVAGIEQINVDKPGRYQVVYRAENENGRSFTKTVPVIVR